MNAAPLNSWYQRPSWEGEFNISLVLTKHVFKSFLYHIRITLLLQKQSLKRYYHKYCTLLIRLPRALYPNHYDTFYIPIVTMPMSSILYKNPWSVYIYTHSLITLSPEGPYIFFQLSSQELSTFIYCFHLGRTWVYSVWYISILKNKTAEYFEILVETRDNTCCHNS